MSLELAEHVCSLTEHGQLFYFIFATILIIRQGCLCLSDYSVYTTVPYFTWFG